MIKKKIEVINEKTTVPEKKVILTPEQQRISNMVDATKNDFSSIDIKEHLKRVEMEVPKGIKKPEFAYRWIHEGNLDKVSIESGGIFEIVTRSNHSHIPDKLFDMRGTIHYKRENILCFTRKDISDKIAAYRIDEFNKKTERAENITQEYAGGKIQMGRVEESAAGANEMLLDDSGVEYGDSPE